MRTTRGRVGIRYAGDPMLTAHCPSCGHTFTALTPDAEATVDHRCPTDTLGPAWTLVSSRGGPTLPRARSWSQQLAIQHMQRTGA
jgi:hypothetical protein